MSKLRILVAALLVAGLLLLPTIALAQPNVCAFYGLATFNGVSVDDGTMVKAFIDGVEVSDATTASGSEYLIKVTGNYSGKTVVFTVGPDDAPAETAAWEAGETINLDLNGIPSTAPTEPSGPASIELKPDNGLVTQVSGSNFIPDSSVTLTVGGEQAVTVTASADGSFVTVIVSPIQQAGTYTMAAVGVMDRSAEAVLTIPDLRGEPGIDGAEGAQGLEGPEGDAGGTGMAVAALIIAIIAVILAILVAARASSLWKR